MNEVLKTIASRYSCRDFTGEPLTGDQIRAVATAAIAAPSAMNRQPWHVILITDKAIVDELDKEGMSILAAGEDKSGYERMMSRGGKLLYNAPCMALILSDGSDWAPVDCGIMCQTIALAAQSIDLSSCIVGMARLPIEGPRKEEFRRRLRFPDGYELCIAVLIGEPNSGKEPHEINHSKVTFIAPAPPPSMWPDARG